MQEFKCLLRSYTSENKVLNIWQIKTFKLYTVFNYKDLSRLSLDANEYQP